MQAAKHVEATFAAHPLFSSSLPPNVEQGNQYRERAERNFINSRLDLEDIPFAWTEKPPSISVLTPVTYK